MSSHTSILAWKIPWTEEPAGPQSMGPESDMTEPLNTSLLQEGPQGLLGSILSADPKVPCHHGQGSLQGGACYFTPVVLTEPWPLQTPLGGMPSDHTSAGSLSSSLQGPYCTPEVVRAHM